ncbi:MAG: tetratricopeptide repeat protein [Candidatus Eremiobacteraeota bacterium]|nr:tetratricopeptide repeat protein [Candidatus Eremiobacteraeota bacterium]
MLAAFLWLQAGIDFMRFRSAMDLRLEACRKIHQGDLPGAIGLLEQAFARDPGQLDIAADLADLYRETGCSEQALFVLNRAVSLSPRRPQPLATVYAQRGLFLLHIGKPLAASQDLRTALRWEPKNEKVRGWLRLADRQLLK